MTEEIQLRPSERLRICLMGTVEDDDEITMNRPAAQALLDEVRAIDIMAGQAADMVEDLREHLARSIHLIRRANTIATFAVGLAIGFAFIALAVAESQ